MSALARAATRVAMAACLWLAAAPVAAQSTLESARSAGYVGERPDGLLGIVGSAPADVQRLVRDINDRRLAQYQEIARRTGSSLPAVQAVAGEKAIAQSPSGSYVMDRTGGWRKK